MRGVLTSLMLTALYGCSAPTAPIAPILDLDDPGPDAPSAAAAGTEPVFASFEPPLCFGDLATPPRSGRYVCCYPDKLEIRRRMRLLSPALGDCYERSGIVQDGKVIVKLAFEDDGALKGTCVVGASLPDQNGFYECVARASMTAKLWSRTADDACGSITLMYPFSFARK